MTLTYQSKFITINAFQFKVLPNQWMISLDRENITRDESQTHKFPKVIAIENAISKKSDPKANKKNIHNFS